MHPVGLAVPAYGFYIIGFAASEVVVRRMNNGDAFGFFGLNQRTEYIGAVDVTFARYDAPARNGVV